jgi:hypothetical protein
MRLDVAYVIENLGGVAAYAGRSEQATRLFGAADKLRDDLNAPLPSGEKVAYDRYVNEAREALGEERFTSLWAEGRSMSVEEAMDEALGR